MEINRYEYSRIPHAELPQGWQQPDDLDELAGFLQQNWEQRAAFYDDSERSTQQQFLEITRAGDLRTKKYIGTIVFKGEQLNIYPRVFKSDKEDSESTIPDQQFLMNNLVRWIEYCSKLHFPFIHIRSELQDAENLKELFITLYADYVRHTIERGLYYQYVDETADCSVIKGKFDAADYLVRKIPNGHAEKFRCTYSKFESDNQINRIIKYTCRHLFNITTKRNRRTLRTILTWLADAGDVQCTPHDCDEIRLDRLHRHYGIILSMSKMFMLNKVSNYAIDTNESFCFLFPTDLLFEGFIGGFLTEVVEGHGGSVSLQEQRMSLIEKIVYRGTEYGAAFTMRHDILAEVNGKVFILDTKYKEVSRFEDNPGLIDTLREEASQNDLYQVLEYARKRSVEDVYLLYPMYRGEDTETEFPYGISESPGGNINVHFVRLPFVFEEDEAKTRDRLAAVIRRLFSLEKADTI